MKQSRDVKQNSERATTLKVQNAKYMFSGKAAYRTTEKIMKKWPNVPLPFDRNQEEPSVLLLWDRKANKA